MLATPHPAMTVVCPAWGCERDCADDDLTLWHKRIKRLLKRHTRHIYGKRPRRAKRRGNVDMRHFFPQVRDQGPLNTSTAFACLAAVEYFERRLTGATCERSKAFLHGMARVLSESKTYQGISIRTTIKALRRFGCPPEITYPYGDADREEMMSREAGIFSDDFKKVRYARLDPPDAFPDHTLRVVRRCLSDEIPVVLAVNMPSRISAACPFPPAPVTRQAVVACGYSDHKQITGYEGVGALLVRNSWGDGWGESGYGWLPYEYIRANQAVDFWILFTQRWLSTISSTTTDTLG